MTHIYLLNMQHAKAFKLFNSTRLLKVNWLSSVTELIASYQLLLVTRVKIVLSLKTVIRWLCAQVPLVRSEYLETLAGPV